MARKATVIEANVSASSGAKVQVVQFQYTGDFHLSWSEKYSLEGYTEEEAAEFRQTKLAELREQLEPVAQEATDEWVELRDRIRDES